MAVRRREESKRDDPYLNFRFHVEIDGLVVAGFSEVYGLQSRVDTMDYREGGLNHRVHRIPVVTRQCNIILARGITDSDKLWDWHDAVANGSIRRKDGRIILMDELGNEKWHWVFVNAYPVRWGGPRLRADGRAVAVEWVELAHNGIKKG